MQKRIALEIHDRLLDHYGPLSWWPGESTFEVIVGAILTQNTAWSRAEVVLDRLRERDLLDPRRLAALSQVELEALLRPAGTFRVRARRLRAVIDWLVERYDGSVAAALAGETMEKRRELLSLHGVGRETADAILLYAGDHPVMVVDTYTRRIFARHGLLDPTEDYDAIADWFHGQLPDDTAVLGELHAQIVSVGKEHCRSRRPVCSTCPLDPLFESLERPRPDDAR